ncbi:hypothetical protein [Dankookia sp. P2]|uniref:hypothetical protein n=1 Tax=Dankookia sp. P2 TaxID=3423955 RepID=UPI003D6773DF
MAAPPNWRRAASAPTASPCRPTSSTQSDLEEQARGGDLHFYGNGSYIGVRGDADWISGSAVGGNDVLSIAGSFSIVIIGDATSISGEARGGDDRLCAAGGYGTTPLGDGVLPVRRCGCDD